MWQRTGILTAPELQSLRHCPGEHGHPYWPFLSQHKVVRLILAQEVRMGGEERVGAPGVPRQLAIKDDI